MAVKVLKSGVWKKGQQRCLAFITTIGIEFARACFHCNAKDSISNEKFVIQIVISIEYNNIQFHHTLINLIKKLLFTNRFKAKIFSNAPKSRSSE